MTRKILLVVLLFYRISCQAQILQNQVFNSSFEKIFQCPFDQGQIGLSQGWFRVNYNSTPDLFHSCATTFSFNIPNNIVGTQTPKDGSSYAGLLLYSPVFDGRENIECELKNKLTAGKSYCIKFYVSLAEESRYAIKNIGAFFSNDSLKSFWGTSQQPQTIYVVPHVENNNLITDTLNWTMVQGSYQANGTEKFLMLGNMRDNTNTINSQVKPLAPLGGFMPNSAYYYIDDVSVVEINPAKAYPTKTITTCANTTFTLGTDSTWDATYQWQPATGLSCTNCPNPIITATANTKYILTKQQCSSTTKDSVYIQIYTPTLTANAGNFKSICSNDTVSLGVNDTTAFTSYSWQPVNGLSCTNCPQPVTIPFSTITYTLTKTECSLTTSDTVSVYVDACEVIIPDIFTPNNDNANDEWKIKLPQGFKLNAVSVYNRWGTLIYTIDDSVLNSEKSKVRVINWDGRTTSGIECSEGVYFYVIHYTDKSGILHKLKGNVTLMR